MFSRSVMEYIEKKILEGIPEFYFGANLYNRMEKRAVIKVISNKAPFRYYGNKITYEAKKYEEVCKQYYNVKYAYAVNSGTAALSCALHALDIGLGDEVIVPGFFWISVSNAIVLRGAVPVFCEINDTLNMDTEDLKNKITSRTKCVIAIHMEGTQAPIEEIRKICDKYNLKLLEDFSQCNGGMLGNKKIGSFGDISISSLQLNKIVTCGEGGIILTNNRDYYLKAIARADCGFPPRDEKCDNGDAYITYGEGRRFSEISAAIMLAQMKKIDKMIKRMNRNKYEIINALGDIRPIQFRRVIDKKGDTGYSIIFIFETADQTEKFLELYYSLYGDNLLRFYRLSDTGYHIYYNCTNLVEHKELILGGYPWKYISDIPDYKKGLLPVTDSLLERSVAIRLPADLSFIQRKVLIKHLLRLIRLFRNETNNN